MRSFFKKLLPHELIMKIKKEKNKIEVFRLFFSDYTRFRKYSFGINQPYTQSQLAALITKNYHSIEKGLSYKNIRLGFGKDVIANLLDLLIKYEKYNYDISETGYVTAISALNEYIKLHEESGYDVSVLKDNLNKLSSGNPVLYDCGGAIKIKKNELLIQSKENYKIMSNSRFSVREFSNQTVDTNDIIEAIDIAKKTPSACNRQAWKVKIVKDPEIKRVLRANQNGNSGFGDDIDTFILVTSDNSYFSAPRERNQSFIDGGMFSMSLLHALHFNGLGTCSLSASLTLKQEKNIRKALNVLDSENLILFIAVGHYVDEFKVPKSNRNSLESFYEII